jgi:hypothetical protein
VPRIQPLREAEINDGQVVEIIANVAMNYFANTLNHVAKTAVDLSQVDLLEAAAA